MQAPLWTHFHLSRLSTFYNKGDFQIDISSKQVSASSAKLMTKLNFFLKRSKKNTKIFNLYSKLDTMANIILITLHSCDCGKEVVCKCGRVSNNTFLVSIEEY